MDYGPLVKEEIAAGEELLREYRKLQPVRVACWLRPADETFHTLHIAVDGLSHTPNTSAYLDMVMIARKFPWEYFGIPRVRLIDGDSPLARDLVEQNERFPNLIPIRLAGMFGGEWADDVYIYPPEVTAPAEAIAGG